MSKPLVIYHASCWDGFCCAYLFHKAFPDADFHAANYGTEPPDCTGRDMYIADFSYKRPVMRQIVLQAHSVTVLDHHKTAQAELDGFEDECDLGGGQTRPEVIFDMDRSGGRLVWEWLKEHFWGDMSPFNEMVNANRLDAPWIVRYTEDRDLWRHELPGSKAINAALRSYPLDFKVWDSLADIDQDRTYWDGFVAEGDAILRAERQIIDTHVSHAREIDMDGHKVLAVNATVLFSEIAGELAAGRPFGAAYFIRDDGRKQWSLRSRDGGVDVSEIAKHHGGGGHRQAAGFKEAP